MAKIIDAFVVTWDFDTSGAKKGERDVRASVKRTKDDAHSAALQMEADGKRAANYFAGLKNEVIGLFLAFAGANSLRTLVGDMISGAAATGRFAANMGVATDQVSAWEGAVRSMGGTAEDARGALGQMVAAYQAYRLTGTTGHDADFQGLGVSLNNLQDPTAALLRMAEAGERLGRPEFMARMQRIGVPDSVITTLARGRRGVQDLLEEQRRLGVVTDENARAAIEFQRQWANLTTQLRGDLRPALTWVIETGLPLLRDHSREAAAGAIGLEIAVAAATVEIWGIPVAIAAAAAALTYLADRFHVLDAWRSFMIDMRVLRLEGDLLNIPNDTREHMAQRLQILQQIGDLRDEQLHLSQNYEGGGAPAPPVQPGSAAGGTFAQIRGFFRSNGYTDAQAAGIAAGIMAESGGNPRNRNPTSGAFGLGQWLGPRQAALFRQYGRNPTMAQQLQFFLGELRGGDPGGPAVGRQQTADAALRSIITGFFRPGAGAGGDYRRGAAYLGGARTAVRNHSAADNRVAINTIVVNVPHGDAHAIAAALPGAIKRRGLTVQANKGLN